MINVEDDALYPSRESFWSSKTMVLLVITLGAVVVLIMVGILAQVVFDVDVFALVAAGITAITGQSTAGVYRNVQVDGAQRKMVTQAAVTAPSGTLEPTVPIGADSTPGPPTPAQQGYVMPSPPPP
jgi:hypothetical protein